MRVIQGRNVHQILPDAIHILYAEGVQRDSRNGPVLQSPVPITTVYEKPTERVVLWPWRDANPFFHLYEALWMLAGRNDVEGPARFAKQMREYSDDGKTFHGAYGYRWRHFFERDQLTLIAEELKKNPEDRRQVLEMWSADHDLGRSGKDLPCNTIATFQINTDGALDLTVFCRSNDIWWGCYGANAVHFSILLEYMAAWIGVPVGRYYQVSVNWHGYLATLPALDVLPEKFDTWTNVYNESTGVRTVPLVSTSIEEFDSELRQLLYEVDIEKIMMRWGLFNPILQLASTMFSAHQVWRNSPPPERYDRALEILAKEDEKIDWIRAAGEWVARRRAVWEAKMSHADTV